MRYPDLLLSLLPPLGALVACGNTSANPAVSSDAAASADAVVDSWSEPADGMAEIGVLGQDATTEMADGAGESASTDDGVAPFDADAEADAASAGDADAADDTVGSCPDVRGQYGITTSGSGCGSVFGSSPPCIREGQTFCDVVFQSFPSGGGDAGPSAINGDAQLQPDGSFANANLTVGTISRMGCTGSWDLASSTMVVTCGGVNASCVLHLKRYASTCN
ncbi:MAG: hypothetical protein M3O46_02445 [Myxococcota bacterium]|nr:hypothetical protein [Myxococcota bacterium]